MFQAEVKFSFSFSCPVFVIIHLLQFICYVIFNNFASSYFFLSFIFPNLVELVNCHVIVCFLRQKWHISARVRNILSNISWFH